MIIIILLVFYGYRPVSYDLSVGSVSNRDIYAHRSFVDTYQTEYEAFIMTAFNQGQNPFSMVHTMCITKEKEGYRRHNDTVRAQYYPSLYEAVQDYHQGRAHTMYVLAIGNIREQ